MARGVPKLSTVVKRGDRLGALVAIRDDLALALEVAPVTVKAQIAGQLRAVIAEIDGVSVPEGSTVDDLAARRSARRGGANPDASASSGGG